MRNDPSASAPETSDASLETTAFLRPRQIAVGDMSIQVVDAGEVGAPAFLFLHGWPQSSYVFRPEVLKAGFDWYRGFARDEIDNEGVVRVDTPVLCLRGDHEPGDLAAYVEGLRQCGLSNVTGEIIEGAGHFTPEENPQAFAARLAAFHPSVSRV